MIERNEKLREKAYKILERKGNNFSSKFKDKDLDILLHELDVYQAELEAQNIELLEKENALYKIYNENKTLFDNAPIAYLHINESFKIIRYNFKADEYLKISNNLSIIEPSLFSFFCKNESNKFLEYLTTKNYTSPLNLYLHSFGSIKANLYEIHINLYPKKENNFIVSIKDIQHEFDLKQSEEQKKQELKELNQFLNQKVQEQIKQIRKKDEVLFQQIKQASLNELLSNIAHQWRQPLNVISLLNILLTKNLTSDKLNKEETINLLEKSNENIQKLSETIDIFSNLFSRNEEKTIFDIKNTIELCLNIISIQDNIQVVFDSDFTYEYFGFKQKFIQSILSIIENSKDAFYTNKLYNRKIQIDIFKSKTNNIIITFLDNAGGIKKEIIDKVCEPYFTTKFKSDGVGLGLYSTKKTIEEDFLGEFLIESRENGTYIVFSLPIEN